MHVNRPRLCVLTSSSFPPYPDAFHQAQERATVSFAATTAAGTNTSAASLSLSLSRSAIGRSSSQLPPPPPVGPLYWVFWLEATAAVRKIAVTAAGKKMVRTRERHIPHDLTDQPPH